MKAILEFNLPEDREEFRMASLAGEAFSILHEVDELLRSATKHGGDLEKALQDARALIGDLLYDHP